MPQPSLAGAFLLCSLPKTIFTRQRRVNEDTRLLWLLLRRNELDGTHGMRRLDRLGFEKRALREGRATV